MASSMLLLRLRLDQDFPIAASIFQRILGRLVFAPKVCTSVKSSLHEILLIKLDILVPKFRSFSTSKLHT
jgi:hypothetical protein